MYFSVTRMHKPCFNNLVCLFYTLACQTHIQSIYNPDVTYYYLFNIYIANKYKIIFGYALHIYKTQCGYKLSVVRKVVTMLNFVTTPSCKLGW